MQILSYPEFIQINQNKYLIQRIPQPIPKLQIPTNDFSQCVFFPPIFFELLQLLKNISWNLRFIIQGPSWLPKLGGELLMARLLFCQNMGGQLLTRQLHPCILVARCVEQDTYRDFILIFVWECFKTNFILILFWFLYTIWITSGSMFRSFHIFVLCFLIFWSHKLGDFLSGFFPPCQSCLA